MTTYYGMDGQEITFEEWGALYRDSSSGRVVARTVLPNGTCVSTVLLGIDHSFGDSPGRPLIFETMVFSSQDDYNDQDMERYCTKEEAQAGHDRMVAKWTTSTPGRTDDE